MPIGKAEVSYRGIFFINKFFCDSTPHKTSLDFPTYRNSFQQDADSSQYNSPPGTKGNSSKGKCVYGPKGGVCPGGEKGAPILDEHACDECQRHVHLPMGNKWKGASADVPPGCSWRFQSTKQAGLSFPGLKGDPHFNTLTHGKGRKDLQPICLSSSGRRSSGSRRRRTPAREEDSPDDGRSFLEGDSPDADASARGGSFLEGDSPDEDASAFLEEDSPDEDASAFLEEDSPDADASALLEGEAYTRRGQFMRFPGSSRRPHTRGQSPSAPSISESSLSGARRAPAALASSLLEESRFWPFGGHKRPAPAKSTAHRSHGGFPQTGGPPHHSTLPKHPPHRDQRTKLSPLPRRSFAQEPLRKNPHLRSWPLIVASAKLGKNPRTGSRHEVIVNLESEAQLKASRKARLDKLLKKLGLKKPNERVLKMLIAEEGKKTQLLKERENKALREDAKIHGGKYWHFPMLSAVDLRIGGKHWDKIFGFVVLRC